MKSFHTFAIASLLLAACEQQITPPGGNAAQGDSAALMKSIETRLASLEQAHAGGTHAKDNSPADPALAARIQQLEATLARREESLAFLDMAYAQQKQQQDERDAGEPDPNAVFAVDISKALAAGQVEGPNSAIVTIVEAWDFA